MSNLAEVRTAVYDYLDEMESTASSVEGLKEHMVSSAHRIRSAIDRGSGHSNYTAETEALFGPLTRIHEACEALGGAIAQMRDVASSW